MTLLACRRKKVGAWSLLDLADLDRQLGSFVMSLRMCASSLSIFARKAPESELPRSARHLRPSNGKWKRIFAYLRAVSGPVNSRSGHVAAKRNRKPGNEEPRTENEKSKWFFILGSRSSFPGFL